MAGPGGSLLGLSGFAPLAISRPKRAVARPNGPAVPPARVAGPGGGQSQPHPSGPTGRPFHGMGRVTPCWKSGRQWLPDVFGMMVMVDRTDLRSTGAGLGFNNRWPRAHSVENSRHRAAKV